MCGFPDSRIRNMSAMPITFLLTVELWKYWQSFLSSDLVSRASTHRELGLFRIESGLASDHLLPFPLAAGIDAL